ncbi:MAG: OPT/YSL family transporter [Sporomusaceae bacterium]|nr:OPT/YSL family transporter [Sporomusaceae bacterium]
MTEPRSREKQHPRAFEPAMLIINIILSFFGAIIGLQIIATLGVTPNTAIIGVLVALVLSRIPLAIFRQFRDIQRQNLVQSTISSATFGAANSLFLPIGIPFLLGRSDLIIPMLIGATMGMVIDLLMLYWIFDSRAFPGNAAWPPGVAAAEAIYAGDEGGKRARLLFWGVGGGLVGSYFNIPMSALGITMISNMWAMLMFATGLLLRGYSVDLFGIDINKLYIPHGFMIGAGLVAGIQIMLAMFKNKEKAVAEGEKAHTYTRSDSEMRTGLIRGICCYVIAGMALALISGLYTAMAPGQLLLWVVFAALACILAEFIVGLSAMHSGWFPAFATSLIFLVLGILLGFPPEALALLVGFVASGGPAFADAGYDFKAGWILRGKGSDWAFEREGRKQQLLSGMIGLAVAWITVAASYNIYFSQNMLPPVDRVFAATIKAGVDPSIISTLLMWAIPGAILQAAGGSRRQMGVLLSTGLLILNPAAGFTVLAGLAVRLYIEKYKGKEAMTSATIVAAGCIAGDALYGFFSSVWKAKWR